LSASHHHLLVIEFISIYPQFFGFIFPYFLSYFLKTQIFSQIH